MLANKRYKDYYFIIIILVKLVNQAFLDQTNTPRKNSSKTADPGMPNSTF